MLVIVGHKITMQQGEDCAFRIIVKDLNGNEVKLSENDVFTMRIRRTRRPDIVLTKVASPVYINNKGTTELIHVFEFNSVDTLNLAFGTYIYDVTLETRDSRYTVISKSAFVLNMSVEFADVNNFVDLTDEQEDEGINISQTPLVGMLSYVEFNRSYNFDTDNIILF